MQNLKTIMRNYEILSSIRMKRPEPEPEHEITRTLNKINLIPTQHNNIYLDETKKEITGGKERKIRVMYY